MFLKQLEIQGFKSFPDRTKVLIERGITAVVGPNGSGKSNISDAIRWVLGETSSRQLRGSGKMEDVIFGGTQTRSAMGYASVMLTVDNSDRRLDVDADEVIIGRKYYRSGESEYSLNGQAVRLRDIYELLLDTGIGRDGYSIIGQGRIAEIVSAKSSERREIFEEASGIAKYRYRKNDAERRLAAAQDNLDRLRDILGELEARVEPLEKESRKAARFLELSQRRKGLEITLWMESIRRSRDLIRQEQRRLESAQIQYEELSGKIENIDRENEGLRARMQSIAVEIEQCNADIRTATEEVGGADSKIAVLKNDIAHDTASAENLRREQKQWMEGSQIIQKEIEAAEACIAEYTGKLELLDRQESELQAKLETIRSDSLRSGERRGKVTAALAELTDKQTAVRVSIAALASSAASMAQRMETARAELEKNLPVMERYEADSTENKEYLAELDKQKLQLGNVKNGLLMKQQNRAAKLQEAQNSENAIRRQMEQTAGRLQMLQDMEKNLDGYQHSVKSVVQAGRSGRLQGILGTLSSLVAVENGYELAIETALGAAMQNIVVENERAAKAAISFLKNSNAGRATFLPLDTIHGRRFDGPLSGTAAVASELVRCDARYRDIVENLLGRVIVVDDLDEGAALARRLQYRNRIVTVDGQVINAGGSFTGGSTSRNAGLFSRRQEMDELKNKLEGLQAQQKKAQQNTALWQEEMDRLSADLRGLEGSFATVNEDKRQAEIEQTRLQTALQQLKQITENLRQELQKLEKQNETNKSAAAGQAAEEARLAAEAEKLAAELAGITEGDDNFLEIRGQLSDALHQLGLDRLGLENEIKLQQAKLETFRARTGESEQRAIEVGRSLKELEKRICENEAEIGRIREEQQAGRRRIADKEAQIRAAAARRMEHEAAEVAYNQKVRLITADRENVSREITRLTERKANAEMEYDQTVARLWDEYQLTESQAQEHCVPFDSAAELRREVNEVKGSIRSLGNVNVGAIEEYKEVKERYDFLSTQVADVDRSRSELLRMIADLSSEMKEIFSRNFRIINENFGRIFRELFGGGTASLSLSDGSNVLESGIDIHVAPPGKVIKSLTALSGGEQALVAISIYFAILAVNPSPFCILDEIEAALDDVNVARYAQYLRRINDKTQFIVITHRRGTMEAADVLYGVTMQEDGVSKMLRLDMENVDASLVS